MPSDFRLTSLSPDGGCSCKVPAAVLAELLDPLAPGATPDALVSSIGHREDAAVWRQDDGDLLVATTDFFTPVVDDAHDFGRIAAANALSDIYAMGARPLFALNILAAPLAKVPPDTLRQIMQGAATICAAAGAPIAGGHSIDLSELVYGLAVVGRVAPEHLRRNHTAQDGDALILGKPLGVGVITAALRRGARDDEACAEMLHWATMLNDVGARLATSPEVHALSDVTGFGLLGHLDEVCRGSNLGFELQTGAVPLMRALERFPVTQLGGGAQRNLRHLELDGADALDLGVLNALADPQTSGGLLVACSPAHADKALAELHAAGHDRAAVFGRFRPGSGLRLL